MRIRIPAAFSAAFLLTTVAPQATLAQTDAPPPAGRETADIPPEVRERLREELRAELMAEMEEALEAQREEIRQEVRAAVAASVAAEDWEPTEWEVEEAPRQTIVDLAGYFRVRMDAFVNFDLNVGEDSDGIPLYPRPPWNPEGADTLAGVNQRLRLQPVFNVAEGLSIHLTADILDNLVWGRNAGAESFGLLAYTGAGVEPISGVNDVFDSIAIKRVWAEVLTPVGLLRFGRMGSHWGMGMLHNDGNCLDCDFGDTVDRVMLVTRVGDFWVVPAIDFPVSGPLLRTDGLYQGQPVDLEQRDDVAQWVLAVAKRDEDEAIRKQVLEGETVLNYGLHNALRVQSAAALDPDAVVEEETARDAFVPRDALVYVPDLWVRLNTRQLRLELEAAGVFGKVGDATSLAAGADTPGELGITQFGAVAQVEYTSNEDKLRVGVEAGFASGDDAPGFGVRRQDRVASEGAWDGRQWNLDPALGIDDSIDNFLFDRDYHVDLILWREIIGRVTDAVYVKPTLAYAFTQDLSFDVAAIYSRALSRSATPTGSRDLGIELDGALRFRSSQGFHMGLQYGILFPLSGLDYPDAAVLGRRDAAIAQTIQGVLGVDF